MQHDQTKHTLRKIDRTRNARTPDRLDVRNMDTSVMNTFSPKRKLHTSRFSTMPSALNTTTTNSRKLEIENSNFELELAYSEYIASHAELIHEKKTLKETELSLGNSLKSLCDETKSLQEKYRLLQTRINDISALSCLNDYSDIVQANLKNFKDEMEKYETKNILSQLETLLNRFNVLRAENIVLPSTAEEVQEFKKSLRDCSNLLHQISDPIECDELENVTVDYEKFVTLCHEILKVKKIIDKNICDLQLEVLKTCCHALSESEV